MSPELKDAIERTMKLFLTRDHALDWSRNIIDGSAGLHSQSDWTRYYSFLNNPTHFDPDMEVKPMDVDEHVDLTPPPEFTVVKHQNGNEMIIEYRRKRKSSEMDIDDEKAEA